MRKVKVGTVDAIKPGSGKGVSLLGKKFAVFNIDGRYYGIDGSCKHMKASLAKGKLNGPIVTCPMHDWQYNVTDGCCLTEDWAGVRTYPVEIEDGQVFIILE